MQETTFTELRNHAKDYFDAVEGGEGQHYLITFTGASLFILSQRIDGVNKPLSDALSLDDFVRLVDSMGPKKIPRVTKKRDCLYDEAIGQEAQFTMSFSDVLKVHNRPRRIPTTIIPLTRND